MPDNGQRYEVRYVFKGEERVLGFTDSLRQAVQVTDHIYNFNRLITEAFVIDRHDKTEALLCLGCRGASCTVCGGTGVIQRKEPLQ